MPGQKHKKKRCRVQSCSVRTETTGLCQVRGISVRLCEPHRYMWLAGDDFDGHGASELTLKPNERPNAQSRVSAGEHEISE